MLWFKNNQVASFRNGFQYGTIFCYFISSLGSREAGYIYFRNMTMFAKRFRQIKFSWKQQSKTAYLPENVASKRRSSFQLYSDIASGSMDEWKGLCLGCFQITLDFYGSWCDKLSNLYSFREHHQFPKMIFWEQIRTFVTNSSLPICSFLSAQNRKYGFN